MLVQRVPGAQLGLVWAHGWVKRFCSVSACEVTCPVCRLRPLVEANADGSRLFPGLSPSEALACLRVLLVMTGVPQVRHRMPFSVRHGFQCGLAVVQAEQYRTHDLRRGHALDLQKSGAPLWQILQAGEWRSPAFLDYLNVHDLERDAVIQAHCDESASEGEE